MTRTKEALGADDQRVAELVSTLLEKSPPDRTHPRVFLGEQFDLGLAWVHFPAGHGGLGMSPKLQKTINERIFAAGGPSPAVKNPIGYGMCGPTVAAWGGEHQKARYLRPLFTGEEIWCQLFSEPGAGSDFAGLSSRGVRDGDEWIVNGQKVWTTLAHLATWGLLVVRTDPEMLKHAGLTAFVVNMRDPTVDVRPLRQMTGEAEFNEVYFTNTRIPDSERLGDVGDGWRVSLTTLMNERVSIGGSIAQKGSGPIAALVDTWTLGDQPDAMMRRDEMMKLWSRAEVLRLTNIRASQMRKAGDPGPEGSIGKLASAELNKDIYNAAMNLLGAEAMLYDDYKLATSRERTRTFDLHRTFLRSRANSIEGGTTEVMKNILGERVLGLPSDVRVDRDVPWSQVPRN
jgi:alkylation response protein AidB-like acyl-CoA dehydrogenase